MTQEDFEKKVTISRAAASVYTDTRKSFTIKNIAKSSGLSIVEVFQLFRTKQEILSYFYDSLVPLYRLMTDEIDDFESYNAGEKLSNFILTLFDLLNEERDFVDQTYLKIIVAGLGRSSLTKDTSQLFLEFIDEDERISTVTRQLLNPWFYQILSRKYLSLVILWLRDESDSQEKTMALVDKLSSFLDEILYNDVLDKGIDLVQYLYSSGLFSFELPVIGELINKFSSNTTEHE